MAKRMKASLLCWSPLRALVAISLSLLIAQSTALQSSSSREETFQRQTSVITTKEKEKKNTNRRLQENYVVEEYPYDLSEYSLRFDKCQNIRAYDDDLAADEDSESPLALKNFVAFRICPSDACDTCETNFGKYVLDVETYLYYTIQNQLAAFEYMCENCDQQCNDNGEYCSGCGKLCYQYQNLEAAGYIDASQYAQCQQLQLNQDQRKRRHRMLQEEGEEAQDEEQQQQQDDQQDEAEAEEEEEEQVIYIGPRCDGSSRNIVIGLFEDENCWQPIDDLDPEDLLGATLSYHLLSHTYGSNDSKGSNICLTCQENEENQNQNDQNDADDVNEMCEAVYYAAAKCETPYGIPQGFMQTNRDDGDYENQVETEFMSCTFIDSIYWNSYRETGYIDFTSPRNVYEREVTYNQKLVLSILGATMAAMLGVMAFLNRKIGDTEQRGAVRLTSKSGTGTLA